MLIPLSRPSLGADECAAVLHVLRSGRLSRGEWNDAFEAGMCAYLDVQHAVSASSGTAGLQVVLHALDLPRGAEVVTTPFTFAATAAVIVHAGLRPVFADIDAQTLQIDPCRVTRAITPRTAAIMAVDLFGAVCDMAALQEIATAHRVPLIEDACEALGATYAGRKAGTFGVAAVFGFYPNKQITTGEGGMIVTDSPALAVRCRALRNHGRPGAALRHEEAGFNARLDEMSAALGVVQLGRIDAILASRRQNVALYHTALADMPNVRCMPCDAATSPFIFYVLFASAAARARAQAALAEASIESGVYFPPLHLEPAFKRYGYRRGAFPVAEDIAARILALPFYTDMPREEIETVARTVREAA